MSGILCFAREFLECTLGFREQSVVFLLLVRPERDTMNVFRLCGKLEIHKLHVLLSAKAKVVHQRLENGLGAGIGIGDGSAYD